jgi:hypothetical protein
MPRVWTPKGHLLNSGDGSSGRDVLSRTGAGADTLVRRVGSTISGRFPAYAVPGSSTVSADRRPFDRARAATPQPPPGRTVYRSSGAARTAGFSVVSARRDGVVAVGGEDDARTQIDVLPRESVWVAAAVQRSWVNARYGPRARAEVRQTVCGSPIMVSCRARLWTIALRLRTPHCSTHVELVDCIQLLPPTFPRNGVPIEVEPLEEKDPGRTPRRRKEAEKMDHPPRDGRTVSRRTLVAGGLAVAGGAAVATSSRATGNIPKDEGAWIAGTAVSDPSANAVDVAALDGDTPTRVMHIELAPGATVMAGGRLIDLDREAELLIAGAPRRDGTVVAHEIVRGVFGEASESERRTV